MTIDTKVNKHLNEYDLLTPFYPLIFKKNLRIEKY